MEILINGLPAAIKKGTSFQFISENRYFTGSDSYTLNITFPLKGCAQNMKIFGNIGRKDISKEQITFDCEIRDREFDKFGTITITELTPEEVKTQFLEGRSEQNFASGFDEIYINELNLGTPASTSISNTPDTEWDTCDTGKEYVALPWVNNTSGNIQNKADYDEESTHYVWNSETKGLSYQPYLTYILKQMASALGYSIEIQTLEESAYGYLLICNALPFAWGIPEFAKALPHWTVTEFFEQLEYLLNGEFEINHRAKTISFAFSKDVIRAVPPVEISKVVDSYTTEIAADEQGCEYQEAANISYASCSHEMWQFYDCPWLIEHFRNFSYTARAGAIVTEDRVEEYDTFAELVSAASAYQTVTSLSSRAVSSLLSKILYAKDIDTYFSFYTWYYEVDQTRTSYITYHLGLLPINVFGKRTFKENSSNEIEVKIVPAWIDFTDTTYGDILFLDPGQLDNALDSDYINDPRSARYYLQPTAIRICEAGAQTESEEYYDKIYVAFWDNCTLASTPTYLPRPAIDRISVRADWSYNDVALRNMRLSDTTSNEALRPEIHRINTQQRFTFSWLSRDIPSTRALFFIGGHRYLCEKITVTFTETGRSQLLKGSFYEVLDSNMEVPTSTDPDSGGVQDID